MKTVGELLVNARHSKNLTIDDLSVITKIDPDHIQNLEKDQYDKLPPPTFIKGFIRNIATVLDQNPNELIAIFRRDYLSPNPSLKTSSAIKNKSKKKFNLNSQLTLTVLGILIFVFYLSFQLRAYIIPPKLNITQPPPQAVVTSPLAIEGQTDPGSIVQVNQNTPLNPDSSGYFISDIVLPPMEANIVITSTNRFGRTTKKTIPITVISK